MSESTDPVITFAIRVRDALALLEAATNPDELDRLYTVLCGEVYDEWWRGLWCWDGKRAQISTLGETCRLCDRSATGHTTVKP